MATLARRAACLASGLLALSSLACVSTAAASSSHAGATAPPTVVALHVPTGSTYAALSFVSCSSAGSCAAGGTEISGRVSRAMVATEQRGVWGPAQGVGPALTGSTTSRIGGIACPVPGSCVAVGVYDHVAPVTGNDRYSGFLALQHGSGWSTVQPIPLMGLGAASYFITALQCPSKNACVILGLTNITVDASTPFAQTWQNGKWGAAHIFSVSALGKGASVAEMALSCPSISFCTAVGQFSGDHGSTTPLSVSMAKGKWGPLTAHKGYHSTTNINELTSVSCVAPGTCVATGQTVNKTNPLDGDPLIMSESAGRWAAPITLASPYPAGPYAAATQMPVVSCVSDTDCSGLVTGGTAGYPIGVATMRGAGHWSVVDTLNLAKLGKYSAPSLRALSCLTDSCVAVGSGAVGANGAGSHVPLVVSLHGKL